MNSLLLDQSPEKAKNVNNLGYFLDGWTELVEGMASDASKVHLMIFDALTEKAMPDVKVEQVRGTTGLFNFEERVHTINSTHPGATTTVYVSPHSSDLLISWSSYLRPIANKKLWLLMIVSSIVIGVMGSCPYAMSGISFPEIEAFQDFQVWVQSAIFTLALGCGLSTAITVFAIELFIVLLLGHLVRGMPNYYFFVEPTVFDAYDVAGMNLTIHKTILSILDQLGVDKALLRRKEQFQRKRGEAV